MHTLAGRVKLIQSWRMRPVSPENVVSAESFVRRCCCVILTGAGVLALNACGDARVADPDPVTRNEPGRVWKFFSYPSDGSERRAVEPFHSRSGGIVQDEFDYGRLVFPFRGDTRATGEVFSSATGETFWVYAEGPGGQLPSGEGSMGNVVELVQTQSFIKDAANATLEFVITNITLQAADAAFNRIMTDPSCDTGADMCRVGTRGVGLAASVSMTIDQYTDRDRKSVV